MNFKISLEQRAFVCYTLANFACGMLFVLLLIPTMFSENILVYYVLIPVIVLEFILVGKLNYDGLKLGLVAGFCNNSKAKRSPSNVKEEIKEKQ
jgi:hypothetical protein